MSAAETPVAALAWLCAVLAGLTATVTIDIVVGRALATAYHCLTAGVLDAHRASSDQGMRTGQGLS
jgi:hypothetical protein